MAGEGLVITQEGGKWIVRGRIDTVNAGKFESKLGQIVKDGQTSVVLNMDQVEFLSSTGIRVILKYYKLLKGSNGKLRIEEPSECVVNVLGMAVLDEILVR